MNLINRWKEYEARTLTPPAAGYVGVASGYATGTACQMFTFKASDGGFDWFCLPIFGTLVAG